MKRNLFFIFLAFIISSISVKAQVALQSDSVIKEMISHKWLMSKVMVKDGSVIPTPTQIKLYFTFFKNGDLVVLPTKGMEKQKWVYDAKQKLLKLMDAKDKSSSGTLKIIKLEEKVMVLFLIEDKDTMYFNRVD